MYVYLAVAILSAALSGAGIYKVQEWRHDAQRAQEMAEQQRLSRARDNITYGVADKAEAKFTKQRQITKTQIQEVYKYVPVAADSCPLPPGWRVLHDAAATGTVPDPSGQPNAAAVTPREAAKTILWNYGAALENAARLEALQEWVSEQLKAGAKP